MFSEVLSVGCWLWLLVVKWLKLLFVEFRLLRVELLVVRCWLKLPVAECYWLTFEVEVLV